MDSPTEHIRDSIKKVDDEIAVGSDLEFQRKWWRFERTIWVVFTIIIILDLLGFFGRGYFANAQMRAKDGTIAVKYERIERYAAPSILSVQFGPAAVRDGQVQLWVSQSVVKSLGNQRVIPEPASSVIGPAGILYTFPATRNAALAEFALQPTAVGIFPLALGVPGAQQLEAKIYFYLLLTVRALARRPGAQLTPFEFVIMFLIGGVIILTTVGDDRSETNAICAVIVVVLMHVLVAWLKQRFPKFGFIVDGTPLLVLKKASGKPK